MIEIVPFEFNHVIQIGNLAPAFKDDPRALERVVAMANNPSAHALTLKYKRKPIAIFVGTLLWGYALDVVAVISEDALKVKKSLFKACKLLLAENIEMLGLGRVQMTVRDSCDAAKRFAERLGFEREGIMRKYGPEKENYVVYGRVN